MWFPVVLGNAGTPLVITHRRHGTVEANHDCGSHRICGARRPTLDARPLRKPASYRSSIGINEISEMTFLEAENDAEKTIMMTKF